MRRALLFALACSACASATPVQKPAPAPVVQAPPTPPPPPPDPDATLKRDVLALQKEARALLSAQAELAWKSWALGEAVDFASVWQGHEGLFSREAIQKIRALSAKEKDPQRARSLQVLRRYLEGELVARAAAEPSDAVARLTATGTITVDGQDYPFRELEALLAGEGHTGKRRKLFKAADPVVRKLEAPLLQREKRLAEAVTVLGYPSYLAFAVELRQADVAALTALAEEVLAKTEAPYRAAMEEQARHELGAGLAEVHRADVPRLFRTGDVDTYFPKDKMVERLTAALARAGLDPTALPQLKIDAEPHARKNPRAIALAVEPGKDVRLSLRPTAGLSATAQLFHETGHAVQQALARADDSEPGLLASGAVGEAVGFLFENLLDDPAFGAAMGIPESKLAAHAKVSALRKLFQLRRYAGRLLFELEWRQGKLEKPEARFAEIMGKALGFASDPEDTARWLLDTEDFLVAADYLRGLVAAFQLDAALGPQWWSDAKAKEKLAAWMMPAARMTVDELVKAAGASGLDPAPLAEAFAHRLATEPAGKAVP
jgi:hypothetical protein